MLAGLLLVLPGVASAAEIELAPQGDEICCDDPDYGVKGYRFTVAQAFTAYGARWLLEVPSGTTAAARIWDGDGALLAEGSVAVGDGSEQWYESSFAFEFEVGRTYEVVFFLEAPNLAQFRRSAGDHSGYDVLPYLTAVESRARWGESDGATETWNSWPPYMTLVLDAPDADADGVPDPDDACPDDAPTTDEDGDGCEDPPPDPEETGSSTTGGADDGGGETTVSPDDPSTTSAGVPSSEDGSSGGAPEQMPSSDDAAAGGCRVGRGRSGLSSLWLLLVLGLRRRAGAARPAGRRW